MAKSDGDTAICFPGEERWELWRLKGGRFELADTASDDLDGGAPKPFKSASHYAFPIHSAYAVPIWAGTDDPSMLGDLVDMQLEKQGLKPEPGPGMLLDYRKAATVEVQAPPSDDKDQESGPTARSLLLASVLNPSYEHPLPRSGGNKFDISPRYLVLPGNHIIIWKELGRLVLALTRGGELVYFQGLSSGELDAATVHEIRCVLLGLEGQGVVAKPSGIHLWVEDVEDSAGALLQEELGLDAIVTLRPDPVLPQAKSGLLPTEVAVRRIEKQRAAKIRNVVLGFAALYLIGVAWYLYDYFKVVKKEETLAARAAELEPQAAWMRPFQQQWMAIEPAINKDLYPADIVYRITGSLPPEGVNISSLKIVNGVITLIGESRSTAVGRSFGAKLFANRELTDFTWGWLTRVEEDPRKKDGTATFRIQGKPKFAWGGAPTT